MNIPLMLRNRKVVGQIVGSMAFLPVTSRNYLAVGKGYSLDDGILQTILSAGAEWLDFWNKKTLRHFRVRVATFQANARAFEFGYGRKWCAPMSVYEPEPQVGIPESAMTTLDPAQPELFGGRS